MEKKENRAEGMTDLQGYFQPGQRKRIYNSCESVRDKVLIRLLWKTGRRIGEILNVKVGDINFDDMNILWNISKKRRPLKRLKSIDTFTLKLLKYYIDQEGLKSPDYIIYGVNQRTPLSRQRAFELVRRACYKAEVFFVGNKRPHPHHFRHTFAINWVKNSKSAADIKRLQEYLEHSNLRVTETYLQFADEGSRDLIEQDED